MFFVASKIFWMVFAPLNLLIWSSLAALLLLFAGWRRAGAALFAVVLAGWLIGGFTSFADIILRSLEKRYEVPVLATPPEGIIVLGGGIMAAGETRSGFELGLAADRIVRGLELKRRYPQARLVFTGGWAGLASEGTPEARGAQALTEALYGDTSLLELEAGARNTWENAQAMARMIGGDLSGWVLITSAWHMERAMGAFRAAGLSPTPFPADYLARPSGNYHLTSRAASQFSKLDIAVKELAGIAAYWASGKYRPAP